MEKASDTLQQLMAATLKRMPSAELPAAAWAFVAGQAVAEKTKVLYFIRGTLTVGVPDETWRAQLCAMIPQFLSRINQLIPIERIEFKIMGT